MWSVESLIQQAESALEKLEPELARQFLQRAIESHPEHPLAYEMLSELFIEQGEIEQAHQLLMNAVAKFPEASPACWISLGQIIGGNDGLEAFKNGAKLLQNQLQEPENAAKLAEVCCAMVELYTTDCCDEPDAESQCESLVSEAMRISPNSAEVYVCGANLRFIQERIPEANETMNKFLELLRENADLKEGNAPSVRGFSYDVRLNGARLLLELGRFEDAAEVLEQLISEDDRDSEIWYLCGMAYSGFEPETAQQYLQQALERAVKQKNEDLHPMIEEAMKCINLSPPEAA